jgi:glycosyltransferase involved in cell wall biosynthesis
MIKKVKLSVCGAFPGKIGGTTILVSQLYEHLLKSENHTTIKCDYTEIQLNSKFGRIAIIWQTLKSILKSDVVLINVSKRGFEVLILPVALSCLFLRAKVIVRYFGGDAIELYKNIFGLLSNIIHYVASKRVTIATETVENIRFFDKYKYNTYQLTNSRPKTSLRKINNKINGSLKLIFMAQLKEKKGVKDIIKAVSDLENVTVDFYGPMEWDINPSDFSEKPNVTYKGVAPLGTAQALMVNYDALIFPTTYEGESHAGVILEAYSVGLPVVTYAWKAIPEIVFHYETGLISSCGDINGLRESIKSLRDDISLRLKMSQNCLSIFDQHFTADTSCDRIIKIIDYETNFHSDIKKPSKWQIVAREC